MKNFIFIILTICSTVLAFDWKPYTDAVGDTSGITIDGELSIGFTKYGSVLLRDTFYIDSVNGDEIRRAVEYSPTTKIRLISSDEWYSIDINKLKEMNVIYYNDTNNLFKIISEKRIDVINESFHAHYEKQKTKLIVKEGFNDDYFYSTDSMNNEIVHSLYKSISSNVYTFTQQWNTKNYYNNDDWIEGKFKFGPNAKYYSFDEQLKTYDNKCDVECDMVHCRSRQLKYFDEDNNQTSEYGEYVTIDTITTVFDIKTFRPLYIETEDTIVNVLKHVAINYGFEDETETELTAILVKNKKQDFNATTNTLCSYTNISDEYRIYNYIPISIYGKIEGVEIEGMCKDVRCFYKSKDGKKFGSIKPGSKSWPSRTEDETFLSKKDGYELACKDGKTSEGTYKNCVKIGF